MHCLIGHQSILRPPHRPPIYHSLKICIGWLTRIFSYECILDTEKVGSSRVQVKYLRIFSQPLRASSALLSMIRCSHELHRALPIQWDICRRQWRLFPDKILNSDLAQDSYSHRLIALHTTFRLDLQCVRVKKSYKNGKED